MQLVLFEPEIPPNTGNIGRLCAATRTSLNLIQPLGFSLDDKHLKRAGLDYWPHVDLRIWPDWQTFSATLDQGQRIVLTSTHARQTLFDFNFSGREIIVLGPESRGLPGWLRKKYPDQVQIPIWGQVRSLNLANAAAVCLYEAYRKSGFPSPL